MKLELSNDKKYDVIYADPPWNYQRKGGPKHIGMAAQTYATMTDDEILSLNIHDIAKDNCFLFLWATFPRIDFAIDVMTKWGFTYKTAAFVWVKTNKKSTDTLFWGIGHYTRSNSEICLLGIKGKPTVVSHGVHQVLWDEVDIDPGVIIAPNIAHSQKPDEARNRIDRLCGDVSKIELFARKRSDGWDAIGDELV